MVDLFSLVQNQVGVFLLIFVRISGIFLLAPIYGSRNVNRMTKIGLAFAITYILYPLVFNDHIVIPDGLLAYGFVVIGELLIGLMFGFFTSLTFSAIQMAGQLLDTQIGFGMVNILDPMSGQQVPLIGNFKYALAMLIFLAINGHHVLLSALFASFKIIPLTGLVMKSNVTAFMIHAVGGMFVIALKISLPILVALVLLDVALGILARTMPQMNIFVVGVPGKIFVGIFVLSLALPFYILFLELAFNAMYKDLYRLLGLLS